MPAPNIFIVYVSDPGAATKFYSRLFDIEPVFITPGYVAYEVVPGALFALWSGRDEHAVPGTPRTSELCVTTASAATVDDLFAQWKSKGVKVVEEPHEEVFGRTFLVADPDGNLIRVAPAD